MKVNETSSMVEALMRTHLQIAVTKQTDGVEVPVSYGSGFFVISHGTLFFVTSSCFKSFTGEDVGLNAQNKVAIRNNIKTDDGQDVVTYLTDGTHALVCCPADGAAILPTYVYMLTMAEREHPFIALDCLGKDSAQPDTEGVMACCLKPWDDTMAGCLCGVLDYMGSNGSGVMRTLTCSRATKETIFLKSDDRLNVSGMWHIIGSPVISSEDGTCIGMVAGLDEEHDELYCVPATHISQAIDNLWEAAVRKNPLLKDSETPGLDYNRDVNKDVPDAIEDEDTTGGNIRTPFNPNEIDVDITNINLSFLIEQLEAGMIDLYPKYQRRPNLWSNVQKSRLIESILLGLPLPSFYMHEVQPNSRYAVIDGLQRCCALMDFVIDKKLKLEGMQFLRSYEGLTYDELSFTDKFRIKSLKITINTLKQATPVDVKYIIFQRVNTAGIPLTPQEMRTALNQGRPVDFLQTLAAADDFKKATSYAVSGKRQQDLDFVNRFVAFYMGFENYDGDLDSFLNTQLGKLKNVSYERMNEIYIAFVRSMKCCYQIFGNDAFRRRYNLTDGRRSLSKAVFDTVSVNIAYLSYEQQQQLVMRKEDFRMGMIGLFNDPEFIKSTSTATGQERNVKIRFGKVARLIDETLKR